MSTKHATPRGATSVYEAFRELVHMEGPRGVERLTTPKGP